jgi:hypothetical protein
MSEDKVFRKKVVFEEVKIPEGCVKCKACDGSGEIRLYYSENPYDRGQFTTCWYCHGQGYVEKEWAEHLEQHPNCFPHWSKKGKSKEKSGNE